MNKLAEIPARALRGAWSFVNPARTAGRLPLGRLAIAVQVVVALAFVGYTLAKKSIRLPLSGEAYQVQVRFADAQGLDRLDEPAAAVAGTPLGSVTDVEYDNGEALATLTFDDQVRGKLFADASVSIRPASALQNLLVNVDPGSPDAGPLPEDEPIPPGQTTGYVTIDELTSVLDADTQAYVTILVEQARISLRGREGELRRALGEVGELADTAAPLSAALAKRRRLLTKLVGELDVVASTLGDRGSQLAEAIDTGNRTLEVTTAREGELAAVTRELGPMLAEADFALAAARRMAVLLIPALDALMPAAEPLAASLAKMNDLLPQAESLTDRFEALVADGRKPLRLMLEGTVGIKRRVAAMIPTMRDLTALSRRLDRHSGGIAQTADTLSAAFSYQDRNGAYGPVQIRMEPMDPANFGMSADASPAQRRRLERNVAAALEAVCLVENPVACVYRFAHPDLPEQPVLRGAHLPGKGGG